MRKVQAISLTLIALICPSISMFSVQGIETNNYYIKGDADGNGVVNIRDVTAIQRAIAELQPATDDMLVRSKVRGEPELSIADATAIQMYLAEYDNPFSVGEKVYYDNPGERFTVTFYDYDETTVLGTQEVSLGETAEPPAEPTKVGASFLGWCGKYDNITQSENVRAVYSDEKNVFVVTPSEVTSSDTVDVLVSVDGNVKTSGFDFNLLYDSNLQLISYDDDLDLDIIVTSKPEQNRIRLNFSSISDREKQRDIIQLTFRIKNTSINNMSVRIVMNSIKELYNNNPVNTGYVIVNGVVKTN